MAWPICAAGLEFTGQHRLPVQFDTAIQFELTNEVHKDEDDACTRFPTLPAGLLVVRIYGCVGLSTSDFQIDDDILVYARVISGATGKSTHHTSFNKGKPVWNEYLFFPVQFTGNPLSKSNRLTILIIWRDEALDKKTGMSYHKLLGKTEFQLHRLAKHVKVFETIELVNRKQQIAGQLQVEIALVYGPFGFGQAFQLENHGHSPHEMVQVSLYPKVVPSYEGPQCRGIAVIPRKTQPSNLIPFNKRAHNLEPTIDETRDHHPAFKTMKEFSMVSQLMTRLPGLHLGLLHEKTRVGRIAYLRGILRNLDQVDSEEVIEVSKSDKSGKHPMTSSARQIRSRQYDIDSSGLEASGLGTISEDYEAADNQGHHKIPKFIASLHRLDEIPSTSSTNSGNTSLPRIDLLFLSDDALSTSASNSRNPSLVTIDLAAARRSNRNSGILSYLFTPTDK